MKHFYLHLLLTAIGYAPLVAQNEIATTGKSERAIVDCPITSLNAYVACDTTAGITSLGTATKIDALPYGRQQDTGTPTVHFVDRSPGQDSNSLFSDGTSILDPTEPIIIDALFVYPNPSNGMVQVKLPGKVSIQVYTLAGELVSRRQMPPGERMLDLTALPAGVYQIRAKSDEDYFSGKLLIQ